LPNRSAIACPRALSTPAFRVVFVLDAHSHPWLRWWYEGTWNWVDLGLGPGSKGVGTHAPIYAPWGYIGVFATDPYNGHLYECYFNNGWHWSDHGVSPWGQWSDELAVAVKSSGYVGVFGTTSIRFLHERYFANGAWYWADQPSNFRLAPDGSRIWMLAGVSEISAVGDDGGYVGVFGSDGGELWERYFDGAWHWTNRGLGGGPGYSPCSALRDKSGGIRVFQCDQRGHLIAGYRSPKWGWISEDLGIPLPDPAPPTHPAPTCHITASPATVDPGGTSKLSWSSQNAASAQIDQGVGTVSTSGEKQVRVGQTTTFSLLVTGPGGTAQAQTCVTVKQPQTKDASAPCTLWAKPPVSGPIPYFGTFPEVGYIRDGRLMRITNPNTHWPNRFYVMLVLPGHSTAGCTDTNTKDAIVLAPGEFTTPEDLGKLYGQQSPLLPIGILACTAGIGALPSIQVIVTYTYTG